MGENREGGDRDLCRGSLWSFIWIGRVNFFFQLYNSLRVLAYSIISFHCFLSCVLFFQLLTPIFVKSFLTSSGRINVSKNCVRMATGVSEILPGYRRNVRMQLYTNTSRLGFSLRPVGLVLDASPQKLFHTPQYD